MTIRNLILAVGSLLLAACGLPGEVERNFSLAENSARAVVIVGVSMDSPNYKGGATWRTFNPATNQAYPHMYGQMAEPNYNLFASYAEGNHVEASKIYYRILHVKPGHYFLARIGRSYPDSVLKVTSYTGWPIPFDRFNLMSAMGASDVDLNKFVVPRFEARAGTIHYLGDHIFTRTNGDILLSEVRFDTDKARAILADYPRLSGEIQTVPLPADVKLPLQGETRDLKIVTKYSLY